MSVSPTCLANTASPNAAVVLPTSSYCRPPGAKRDLKESVQLFKHLILIQCDEKLNHWSFSRDIITTPRFMQLQSDCLLAYILAILFKYVSSRLLGKLAPRTAQQSCLCWHKFALQPEILKISASQRYTLAS